MNPLRANVVELYYTPIVMIVAVRKNFLLKNRFGYFTSNSFMQMLQSKQQSPQIVPTNVLSDTIKATSTRQLTAPLMKHSFSINVDDINVCGVVNLLT